MNPIDHFSYWEHFKAAKDLALVLGPNNSKVKAIMEEANKIMDKFQSDKGMNFALKQ